MAVRWTFLSAPSWPIDTNILFTINTECNGKILVSCRNGVIVVDVYRKSPHRDRYLDFNSHHDNQHKVSTASTLLHRALNLPNSSKRKKPELNYVHAVLESNSYPSKFIKNIQAKKLDPQQQMYPQKNLLECFSRWLNQPSHASLSLLFLTAKE